MKNLIFILLLSCTAFLSVETSPKLQCCKNNVIMKNRSCGGQMVLPLPCKTRIILEDIVLKGDKVSTQDSPDFTFVEDTSQYCIGVMERNNTRIPIALVCLESTPNNVETSGILQIVSVVFLLLTIAVYTYLPQLRDLQGLCCMCMCISMAIGFLSLGILQFKPNFKGEICAVTGFMIYSWMMATFFWMNVICINMYRTVKDATYLQKTASRQYFWYSCYGWGGPILLLIVSLIANFVEGDHWKPGISDERCWFIGNVETWIFFYGPIAVLISVNIACFVLSSINLWQKNIKYDVNKLNILRHKFLLSLKLFLVMGISWIFEIASFAHGEAHIIWKIMDTFNCLQGLVIFLLLVVLRKRAIMGLVSERCCLPCLRPLAERLSPHDDLEEQALEDDASEVRLN